MTAGRSRKPVSGALRARQKFLGVFPKGFYDDDYVGLERAYKAKAHDAWQSALSQKGFAKKIRAGEFREIADLAVRINRGPTCFSHSKRWRCAMPSKVAREPSVLHEACTRSFMEAPHLKRGSEIGSTRLPHCLDEKLAS